ncbi:hypothetical protein THIOKS11410002 [Thiocapsa sp. KS1]|nr:hypothetical protein THIOKS11410002 [Thiocapsa sp. KS1]
MVGASQGTPMRIQSIPYTFIDSETPVALIGARRRNPRRQRLLHVSDLSLGSMGREAALGRERTLPPPLAWCRSAERSAEVR